MAGLTQGAMGVAEVIASCGVRHALLDDRGAAHDVCRSNRLPHARLHRRALSLLRQPRRAVLPMILVGRMLDVADLDLRVHHQRERPHPLLHALHRGRLQRAARVQLLAEATRSITLRIPSAATTSDGLLAANCAMLTAVLLQMVSGFARSATSRSRCVRPSATLVHR